MGPDLWEFAGWGEALRVADLRMGEQPVQRLDQADKGTLGPWQATAICGNDITSSCLYVSALCAAHAGILAPVVLLIVAAVLYLFRSVYAEVGSALPLNGGCYTVLLNTTNKRVAAAAACLTILSYMATAVISAGEAMHYAHNLWAHLDVFTATLGVLACFALLGCLGITESAKVALVIFLLHMATLTVLAVLCGATVVRSPELLVANWQIPSAHGVAHALFFGFASAMLGISGFESSANYIEEQKPGVFPKTLRNMWIAVAVFNPLISFLSMGLLPLGEIQRVPPDLLAQMGRLAVGETLQVWVSIDAVLVLSGAVLTSFVGVAGLTRRMALDRCLPQFLLRTNRLRGTNHWIYISFFLVCTTIMFLTGGRIETLAGVYTLSFLAVMGLFAVGNMLLKVRRGQLPRNVQASWPAVSLALVAVMFGLAGNIVMDPLNVEIFAGYFLVVAGLVAVMFLRIQILRAVLFVLRAMVERVQNLNDRVGRRVRARMDEINQTAMVYFTGGDALEVLNKAALYVLDNEQTNRLQVVHVYREESDIPPQLAEHLKTIDHLYPQLRIDFVAVKGEFGPELIDALSRRLRVPKNQMFIGTPGAGFPHRVETLGGVRLIT